jgi:4-amino-4-deoxy-L-arabinose transferase-like glycosyltransferase
MTTLATGWQLPEGARKAALYCLIACWIGFGLLGRDPWKPDEAYTFGLVLNILQAGDFVIPTLASEPFVEKPPLFFLSAALSAKLFGAWLPLHDAARLASAFYVALTLIFVALTARKLYGSGRGVVAALVLMGCLGFIYPAHLLITDNSLVAGIAIALYGFAAALDRPVLGGFLIGSGAGVAFLSKGLIGPGFIGMTAALLPLLPAWRTRSYAKTLATATLAAAPWVVIWPALLYQASPTLFHEWLHVNNLGRFSGAVRLGGERDHLMYLKILPWFALPAWPLAGWSLFNTWRRGVRGLQMPAIALPLLAFLVMFGVLSAARCSRNLYALPMLLPLSLLAVSCIEPPPAWLRNALSRIALWTSGSVAVVLWVAWAALLVHWPADLSEMLESWRPGFTPGAQPLLTIAAALATAGWLAAMRERSHFQLGVPVAWAAGVALSWGLMMTLWLPYLDAGNSYRSLVADLQGHLPRVRSCLVNRDLGESQRAMLHYFAGIVTHREGTSAAKACSLLVVQVRGNDRPPQHGEEWNVVWNGSRPGDAKERYWLLRRTTEEFDKPVRVKLNQRRHSSSN